MEKELSDIALHITEPEYRTMPELSYSTLATYERTGFSGLDHLFDRIETPSLTLGSLVDTLITSTDEEFDNLYFVADFPTLGDKETQMANLLYQQYGSTHISISLIPFQDILGIANVVEFQKNWKDETRVKVITERCSYYYGLKAKAGNRTIIDFKTFETANDMARALKESSSTAHYFAADDPFSPIKRYYQLKFKFMHNNVGYRSMLDLVLVNYDDKTIIPVDLKTSGHPEWDFEDSFIKWNYMIQARLYWRNLRANLDADPYFKNFELLDYRFIVVNKNTLTPLVWIFPFTQLEGTLVDKEGNEYRDPYEIGEELRSYLDLRPAVPKGIKMDKPNRITCLKLK